MLSIGHWLASSLLLCVIWCDMAYATAVGATGTGVAVAAAGVTAGTLLIPASLVVGVSAIALCLFIPAVAPAIGSFVGVAIEATAGFSVATGVAVGSGAATATAVGTGAAVSVAAGTAVASSSTTLFGSSQWSIILLSSILLVYFLVKQ
jgi:hypothetical protein